MDLTALGHACDEFCAIADARTRADDPFGTWLARYRRDGIYPLALYVTRHEDGYLAHGNTWAINWIPSEETFFGYPSERPGGAKNYRYEVPADAFLPAVHRAP